MVADMVAFVASQFTTSTWDVGAQELCSVVLIKGRDGIDSQKTDLFSGFFLRPCPNFYLADREFSLVISTPGPN